MEDGVLFLTESPRDEIAHHTVSGPFGHTYGLLPELAIVLEMPYQAPTGRQFYLTLPSYLITVIHPNTLRTLHPKAQGIQLRPIDIVSKENGLSVNSFDPSLLHITQFFILHPLWRAV